MTIVGRTQEGGELRVIPYYAWDNRIAADTAQDGAQDWMVVWLKQAEHETLRQQLEGDERNGWKHKLYRPLSTKLSW